MSTTTDHHLPDVESSEFDSRLARVRENMVLAGIEVLVVSKPENIYYLSGFQTLGYWDPIALIVPLEGGPIHFQLDFEAYNVLSMSPWRDRIRSYAPRDLPGVALGTVLLDSGWGGKRVGVEKASWFFTVGLFEELSGTLPEATIEDGSGIVERVRFVKSPTELAYIREAGRISTAAMMAAIDVIGEGASENDVAAAAYSSMIGAGGEYPAIPVIVSSGERASQPHATWAGRKFRRGDIGLLEIGASVRRYHAASIRNAVIGQPSQAQTHAADAAYEALDTAIAAIAPGTSFEEVDRVCRRVMDRRGVGRFFLQCSAYPVGIGFPPSWGEQPFNPVMQEGEKTLIEPGMVFHVIPTSNDPSRVGGGHIGASDMVVATENGCEMITSVPHELFVR